MIRRIIQIDEEKCNDIWGNTGILGSVAPGSVFAEVYACIPGQPMLVTVSAVEDTSVFL